MPRVVRLQKAGEMDAFVRRSEAAIVYHELLAIRRHLERATARPGFAYVTIVLLQLKVVWGMWQFRDLTPGDTAVYFLRGFSWYQNWSNDISWSPLYTASYGSFLHLSTDAVT